MFTEKREHTAIRKSFVFCLQVFLCFPTFRQQKNFTGRYSHRFEFQATKALILSKNLQQNCSKVQQSAVKVEMISLPDHLNNINQNET